MMKLLTRFASGGPAKFSYRESYCYLFMIEHVELYPSEEE